MNETQMIEHAPPPDLSGMQCYNQPFFKVCSKCREEKSVDEFWKCKLTKDKLRSACKCCLKKQNNEYGKEYRAVHKDKVKQKNREYHQRYNYKHSESYKRNHSKNRRITRKTDKETLHRRYCYKQLYSKGFKPEDITPELIEVQRIILKTKRLCKTLQNSEQV